MDEQIKERTQAETVKALIAQQFDYPGKIEGTQTFAHDLKGDSLDNFELVMALEDEFGVDITDDQAGRLNTVQDCIDLVERLTA